MPTTDCTFPVIRPLIPSKPRLRFIDDAPDGAAPKDAPDDAPETDGDAEDTDTPVEGEDALGDPGKRALEATKKKYKDERAKRLALETQLREATAPKGDTPDAEAIQAEADRKATAKANTRIVRAEVKGAAAAVLKNPADALAFLDLTAFEVDDDGEVDADEIDTALKDLLAERPYLAKDYLAPQGGSKRRIPEVPADPANKPSTPASLDDQIAAAQKAGNPQLVIHLQNQKLANQ